ncbi:PIN domain-containing protein [Pseudonocardia phyllosphaerae]|uniref:PIN domain-containing protein n=1 Tax=Pseudonocardia phyllosphaerae TaxID=3390502 RepID=UPI00397B87E8
MSYLLDTNVAGELRKPKRLSDPAVRAWTSSRVPSELHLCVITILEIELGIGRLERRDSGQADRLRTWIAVVEPWEYRPAE